MRRSFLYPSLGLMFCLVCGASYRMVSYTGPASPPPSSKPASQPAPVAAGEYRLSAWKPVFAGIEACEGSTQTPRLMQMRALRVDLHDPGVSILVTPSNGKQRLDVNARTTTGFLSEFKCQAAINASFFGPLATQPSDPQDITGLSVSRGNHYSPPGSKFAALLFDKDKRAWIAAPPVDGKKAFNAVAGDTTLLVDGRYSLPADDRRLITITPHPRSAAGISRDGRYLILMTIDGRQPGYSEGATKPEEAAWLKKLGAWSAINLDGGGSTTLVIAGADGKPEILNRPCGPPVGTQRRVANHIGIFAKPLRPAPR